MSTPDASNAALRSSYDTRISWFRAGEADPTASSEAETARTLLHQRPLNSSDRRTEGQIRIRREDGTHPLTTITVQDYSFDVESEKSVEFAALTYDIIGAAMEVHGLLGPGFLESIYKHALLYELSLSGLETKTEVEENFSYKEKHQ